MSLTSWRNLYERYLLLVLLRTGKLEYVVGIRVLEGVAGGHKDPDEYVFHGVMEMGVHGTSQIAISYPPMQVIRDYFAQF